MNETTTAATELAVAARNEPPGRVTRKTKGEAKAVAQNRVGIRNRVVWPPVGYRDHAGNHSVRRGSTCV